MSDYHQPQFYRFNQDSLELVKFIQKRVNVSEAILDLGAGCGIIGLELAQHFIPKQLTLLELQSDYAPYLEENVQRFLQTRISYEIVLKSIAQWEPQRQYDLIACNPPYYLPYSGQSCKDPRRALARSFIKDNWRELLLCIERSLSDEGRAYVVVKNEVGILNVVKDALHSSRLRGDFIPSSGVIFIELVRLDKN